MQQRQPDPQLEEYEPAALAHEIVEVASDRKATDVVMLDIRKLTTFADYFVIMTGTSTVQVRALSENIRERLQDEGVRANHAEGSPDDGWLLIDYGSVVVHIFRPEQRAYYELEQLWSDATTVVRVQ
jgi:ribosome-associated protein